MAYYRRQRSGIIQDEGLGLVHVYFGEGVGKTTRAVGLALRAAGEKLRVTFVQFMKSGKSGESVMLKKISNITYFCPGPHPFILSKGPEKIHYHHARSALNFAYNALESDVELLICDEILNTLVFNLLKKDELLKLVSLCKSRVELVMTGRTVFPELMKVTDYATEFVLRKHPYYRGAKARRGIEY